MLMLRRIFPQSLIGRVFALYSATLLLFVGGSLSLFYQYQYNEAVEDAQRSATMLIEVAAQTVSDSAVIGDYDTIARTLDKAILRSQFASAVFIDLTGGRVESGNADLRKTSAPDWLQQRIATQLYDVNRTISVGGTDYGVLRLAFASENVAESLWQLLSTALGLAFASLAGGLLLIWLSLKRWLGTLDRVHTFEREALNSGSADKADPIDDVPLEFRPAFEILQRTTDSLRRELLGREQALKSLREIVASLLPASELPAEDDGDIAVLSKVIATMVAEREASRQALEEAKNAAEAANLAKSRFLATMSHEIRTPMNGILGMAQMLLMTEVDDADRRDYARTILGSGQTLLTLLNDILDLSKIEAGKLELETASFAPASLVDDVMSLFAEPARAKNLQLTANWSGMAQQ
jgi:signal transduction histidine kinase